LFRALFGYLLLDVRSAAVTQDAIREHQTKNTCASPPERERNMGPFWTGWPWAARSAGKNTGAIKVRPMAALRAMRRLQDEMIAMSFPSAALNRASSRLFRHAGFAAVRQRRFEVTFRGLSPLAIRACACFEQRA
jgi:hypothetical protein